ncbi:hypothetical protein EMIHUDRAFT_217873 [Emiliania huxleyi CCMP1516]|uniref:Glycoside hydrolase family 5 domain-containing protein n=2 Tax=Emiliania huxleyi TaxID=2903 RepID=A0A0D3I9G0_EMIH1|nr:hypothetical protein EMIHUDRAFT_217873 [Emiliania huxleyi CCMP1516]EOD07895.1 hypothetical protein EMIHUDRAFT_217873 [Emiliania huxleyi CCMP1516]|eukprot:XP_005760324.1 hypothetical protein EMIHUDRAFT_217873 [Emiliania huxleyi CCMP1516]
MNEWLGASQRPLFRPRFQISDRHIVNSLPAGFASFTLDFHPSSQGSVWGANASILEIDLASPGLLGVVTALAPAVLRLGGSEAGENVTYVGFPGFDAPCPSGYYYCLTRPRWAAILAFAARTGVRLMLDLNLIGPGTADDWPAALSQIDALFSYTAQQPPRLRPFAFELGRMTRQGGVAPAAAARVAAVGALLASRWPDEGQRPLLVGPSVHIQPDWIVDFVLALPAPLPLDVFTYHMYEGYGKAPRIAAQTAAAWASGGPTGACTTFESSLWYFDHLAHAASTPGGGHLAVARQTLAGGNYSLVDSNRGYIAHSDYFVARLAHHALRSFAACDPSGRLVVGVANAGGEAIATALQLGQHGAPLAGGAEAWVRLNGQPLSSVGGEVPELPPVTLPAPAGAFSAPPFSVAFLRYAAVVPEACGRDGGGTLAAA